MFPFTLEAMTANTKATVMHVLGNPVAKKFGHGPDGRLAHTFIVLGRYSRSISAMLRVCRIAPM